MKQSSRILEKGVFSNFAQILDGNKGRIRYNTRNDTFIEKAGELLHNHIAYSETFQSVTDN